MRLLLHREYTLDVIASLLPLPETVTGPPTAPVTLIGAFGARRNAPDSTRFRSSVRLNAGLPCTSTDTRNCSSPAPLMLIVVSAKATPAIATAATRNPNRFMFIPLMSCNLR